MLWSTLERVRLPKLDSGRAHALPYWVSWSQFNAMLRSSVPRVDVDSPFSLMVLFRNQPFPRGWPSFKEGSLKLQGMEKVQLEALFKPLQASRCSRGAFASQLSASQLPTGVRSSWRNQGQAGQGRSAGKYRYLSFAI